MVLRLRAAALCVLLALLVPAGLVLPVRAYAQELPTLAWEPIATVVATGAPACLDPTRPSTVVVAEAAGSVAYDWATGAQTLLSPHAFDQCGPAGLLFDLPDREGVRFDGPTWRLNLADGTTTTIAHAPTHLAADGTVQLYALHEDGHLWASPDGGLAWQRRGRGLAGKITSLAVSAADARAIYAVTVDPAGGAGEGYERTAQATIFFSPDAGRSWEQRAERTVTRSTYAIDSILQVVSLAGATAPVTTLRLNVWDGSINPSSHRTVLLSTNGARSFQELGLTSGFGNAIDLVHTGRSIVRLVAGRYGGGAELAGLADDGQTWLPLALPDLPPLNEPPGRTCITPGLQVTAGASTNLLLCIQGRYWYSPDSGGSWQALDAATERPQFPPAFPPQLLDLRLDGRLYHADLPGAGWSLTLPVVASGAPGSRFFPETGHNLAGSFGCFWEAQGGLARFGYPRTEPFREQSLADGRVALVQYFERARLEYVPPSAGAPGRVRIGLLGSELTEHRRASGEPPFQPVADPQLPAVSYFPQTGHTVRDPFGDFWRQHGGLAQFGYPLSEEFSEMSVGDAQPYQVQYFERVRLELHPGPTGERVLIGLVGTESLHARGF